MTDGNKNILRVTAFIIVGVVILMFIGRNGNKNAQTLLETPNSPDTFGNFNVPELAFPEFVTPQDFAIMPRDYTPAGNPPIPFLIPNSGKGCCDNCASNNPLPFTQGFLSATVKAGMGGAVSAQTRTLINNRQMNYFSGGDNRGIF